MRFLSVYLLICFCLFSGLFLVFKTDDLRFVSCEVDIGGVKHTVYVSLYRNDVEYDCAGGYRANESRFSCYILDSETLPSFFSFSNFNSIRSFHIFVEASFLDNGRVYLHSRFENFTPANRKEGSILQKIIIENEYPEPYRIFESVASQIFLKFNPPLKMKAEKE